MPIDSREDYKAEVFLHKNQKKSEKNQSAGSDERREGIIAEVSLQKNQRKSEENQRKSVGWVRGEKICTYPESRAQFVPVYKVCIKKPPGGRIFSNFWKSVYKEAARRANFFGFLEVCV
jgi:hypothetical protein